MKVFAPENYQPPAFTALRASFARPCSASSPGSTSLGTTSYPYSPSTSTFSSRRLFYDNIFGQDFLKGGKGDGAHLKFPAFVGVFSILPHPDYFL